MHHALGHVEKNLVRKLCVYIAKGFHSGHTAQEQIKDLKTEIARPCCRDVGHLFSWNVQNTPLAYSGFLTCLTARWIAKK